MAWAPTAWPYAAWTMPARCLRGMSLMLWRFILIPRRTRKYIVTVPLSDKVTLRVKDQTAFSIVKKNTGKKITSLSHDGRKIDGFFLSHHELTRGGNLVMTTQ